MTFSRLPRSQQPADEQSGRYILTESTAAELSGWTPLTVGPRKSTPPSPAKAALFRMRQQARDDLRMVARWGWVIAFALPILFCGLVLATPWILAH